MENIRKVPASLSCVFNSVLAYLEKFLIQILFYQVLGCYWFRALISLRKEGRIRV